jgi:hypothetical protein
VKIVASIAPTQGPGINHFPLFVYIQGNKNDTNWKIGAHGQRAFTKTGLQVVFALLCNPELANEPIRYIADIAGVAIGTVDAVFNNLKEFKFLIDRGKRGRRLLNKENLLERWVTGFLETLRKRLIVGKYSAIDQNWWKGIDLPRSAYWAGEVAAARLTAYLQPEIITIYTHADYKELLLKYKLKKDPQGEIEVLKAFWNKEVFFPRKGLAHPLLVYADLLAHGDSRNLETAKRIYEEEIAQLVREH